jgi:hypothetical protein
MMGKTLSNQVVDFARRAEEKERALTSVVRSWLTASFSAATMRERRGLCISFGGALRHS